MEPEWVTWPGNGAAEAKRTVVAPARPVVPPAPRSAMFFPLVVLVAVLPGLYALGRWDLNPPSPWWGLRGLAVLDGHIIDQTPASVDLASDAEAGALRTVAWQPPIYAWLEAIGLFLSTDRAPLATVLPSYLAGVLVVLLIYLHGRLWRGPGLALMVALLTAFSRDLLLQMQQATPITLGLAFTMLTLLCYGQHLHRAVEPTYLSSGYGNIGWAIGGGFSFAFALLSIGPFALICLPVIILHQAYMVTGSAPIERPSRWWTGRSSPSLTAGALALVLATAIAAPWYLQMYTAHGRSFIDVLLWPPDLSGAARVTLLSAMLTMAPATLPLSLYAAFRIFRQVLAGQGNSWVVIGGVFWLLWLGVAIVVPSFWPTGPRPIFSLFLLVPLNSLAALAINDLATRRTPVRALTWLVPLTLLTLAWWSSSTLRAAIEPIGRGQAPTLQSALVLHFGLDLLCLSAIGIRLLVRWGRRRDDRQRLVIGCFLSTILAITATFGIREVRFRHRETKDLLILRDAILRMQQDHPFATVAVVGTLPGSAPGTLSAPGGRLRFILQSALPHVPQVNLAQADELLNLPRGQTLVILVGEHRLPYTLQAQLGLCAIHPGRSGVLDAFATVKDTSLSVHR